MTEDEGGEKESTEKIIRTLIVVDCNLSPNLFRESAGTCRMWFSAGDGRKTNRYRCMSDINLTYISL